MSKKAEFILAGCSVSSGVPAIGNDWGKCDPSEPKNKRDRPCAIIRTENTTIAIDTGPDFRSQMNHLDIASVDAVFYTHAHSDHIQGIDELRMIRNRTGKLIDVYANAETMDILQNRFSYMFEDTQHYHKVLTPHIISNNDYGHTSQIGDIPYQPYYQDHGDCECLGFRFGNIGYSVDMVDIDDNAVETLKGVDIWLADGAGHYIEDHKTHASINKVIQLNERIGAPKVYVIGLSKFMDYRTLENELPEGYEPSYDGLTIPVLFP